MKRVLIITYYWPPAGGPGVQRWLNFVKYLPKFGIQPIIYRPENPNYPIQDTSLLSTNLDVDILTHPISEPYKFAKIFSKKSTTTMSSGIIPKAKKQSILQKLLLFIRGNFFIPDARKSWVKPSINYLTSYLNTNPIDVIITTGPPHSLHLIGLQLQENLNIKWISDFRDPWTSIGYHKELKLTHLAKQKHKTLESKVLNAASHIITTSFTTKTEFETITNTPITVITNGFNASDFNLKTPISLDKKFTLAHIGSLLSNRNPDVLWQVLYELTQENIDFAKAFQLKLAGTISKDIVDSLKHYKLESYVNIMGYVSHKESFKIMQSAQVLLLVEINSIDTVGIIPGKLYEYLLANRPILAIGPKHWDAAQIIKTTQAGDAFTYNDKQNLKLSLINAFNAYKLHGLKSMSKNIDMYSRLQLTQQLSEVINTVIT